MYYYISKIGWFFLQPSTLLAALALLGAVLCFSRLARVGRLLALLACAGLLLGGLSPLGHILMFPLEDRFARPAADAPPPDGIIVLGGSLDTAVSNARGTAELNEAAERLTAAAELARRYPEARLVFSGGIGMELAAGETESSSARRLFAALGIDLGRVTFENRSRNTWQNARLSKDLVQPEPGEVWWLVTSAFHMPRAMGCFEAVGFPVRAYPVDFRTRGATDYWRPFPSVSAGLRRVDIASREWLALLVYRMTGRIPELLPEP